MRLFLMLSAIVCLLSTSVIAQPGGGEGVGGGTGVSGQRLPKGCIFGIVTDSRGVSSCAITPPGGGGNGEVVNITDYGAVCDGVTDDTAAINNAFAAVSSSLQYTQSKLLQITGPANLSADVNARGCVVTSVNMTAQYVLSGADRINTGFNCYSTPRFCRSIVELTNLTLLCKGGAGSVCLDMTGAVAVNLDRVQIIGCSASSVGSDACSTPDETDHPAIGIQQASVNSFCCIAHWNEVTTSGAFSFAAVYLMESETHTIIGSRLENNAVSNSGVIGKLGKINGGSGYAAEFGGTHTYSNIPLTGGSPLSNCTSGNENNTASCQAEAKITVVGGVVTDVYVKYAGKGYAVNDVLSAASNADPTVGIGAGGTGFSVSVSQIHHYALVLDGNNHWRAWSQYSTVCPFPFSENPVFPSCRNIDSNGFFSGFNFIGGSLRQGNPGAALWSAGVNPGTFTGTYYLSYRGPYCVVLFDNDHVNPNNIQFNSTICETGVDYHVFLTGDNPNPTLPGFQMRVSYTEARYAIIGTDTNITSVTAPYLDFRFWHLFTTTEVYNRAITTNQLFSNPSIWNVSGSVNIPSLDFWDSRTHFSGQLCFTNNSFTTFSDQPSECVITPSQPGTADVPGQRIAWGYSCARRLLSSYTGPLCNIRRVSDDALVDMYPKSDNSADILQLTAFCGATAAACTVHTAYDQSGNGINATQTTKANEPVLVIGDSSLGGRVTMSFGTGGSALALLAPNNNPVNDNPFWNQHFGSTPSGGVSAMVFNQTGVSAAANRLWDKTWTGVGYVNASGDNRLGVFAAGNVTDGSFVDTVNTTNGGHIIDIHYAYQTPTLVPDIWIDGRQQVTTNTPYTTGARNDDNVANPIVLGNTKDLNKGFPGNVAEFVLWYPPFNGVTTDAPGTPALFPYDITRYAFRVNQAAFYGLSAPPTIPIVPTLSKTLSTSDATASTALLTATATGMTPTSWTITACGRTQSPPIDCSAEVSINNSGVITAVTDLAAASVYMISVKASDANGFVTGFVRAQIN